MYSSEITALHQFRPALLKLAVDIYPEDMLPPFASAGVLTDADIAAVQVSCLLCARSFHGRFLPCAVASRQLHARPRTPAHRPSPAFFRLQPHPRYRPHSPGVPLPLPPVICVGGCVPHVFLRLWPSLQSISHDNVGQMLELLERVEWRPGAFVVLLDALRSDGVLEPELATTIREAEVCHCCCSC